MKITVRLPSKAVPYGYVEYENEIEGELTPSELGQHYAAAVKEFHAAEKPAAPKTPDITAQEMFEQELGATKVAEEKHTHKFVYGDDDNGHSGSYCECGEEDPGSDKPWTKKAESKAKPWESKPDLFG